MSVERTDEVRCVEEAADDGEEETLICWVGGVAGDGNGSWEVWCDEEAVEGEVGIGGV
jgi:hypothetical protein